MFLWPAACGLEDEMGLFFCFFFSLEVSVLDCFLGRYYSALGIIQLGSFLFPG